jgi:hypothetical protein
MQEKMIFFKKKEKWNEKWKKYFNFATLATSDIQSGRIKGEGNASCVLSQ